MRRITITLIPISRTLCLAVCWRECQYFQFLSCSSLHLSSPKTTMITLWSRSKNTQDILQYYQAKTKSKKSKINYISECNKISCYPTQILRVKPFISTSTLPLCVLSPLPHLYNTVPLQLRASHGALLTTGWAPSGPVWWPQSTHPHFASGLT